MERFENRFDFINELNENGRIPYDDYSRLFDLVQSSQERRKQSTPPRPILPPCCG